jgi:hypothetical protein
MSDEQMAMLAKIAAFASRFDREAVRPLLQGWDRRIIMVDQQTEEALIIEIAEGALANMAAATEVALGEQDVVIRGRRDDLMELLDGTLHPSEAVLDDRIQVSAHPDDQIKLDALSFALWDD